jgi:ribosomal protein L20A (L18A)
MESYVFEGRINLGGNLQKFEREVEAESLGHARDKLFSQLCSEHSVKRSSIDIEEYEE